MKKLFIALLVLVAVPAVGQLRNEISIPDIEGYVTLKCDFHIHSVFSDAYVWPTVRVDEAVYEGLDAIAITEHIEYRPYGKDLTPSHNRSHEIAAKHARGKGLIVIRGSEITRGMPPGHFNAIFLDDCDPLDTKEYIDAFQAAASQDAFIFWNHPGWASQAPDTTVWMDEHTMLYDKGFMHGIELVNSNSYYPEAHQWALDKGLTMLGNSDIHQPMQLQLLQRGARHRPVTLVFAATRDQKGIKDALKAGRTAVYHNDEIYGREEYLRAIFMASVKVLDRRVSGNKITYVVKNESEIPLYLKKTVQGGDLRYFRELTLQPFGRYSITFTLNNGIEGGKANFEVTNLHPEPGKGLRFSVDI